MLNQNKMEKQIHSATKWSTLGEGVARLISPITNMILARFLAPEAFGIVATITMLTSFADIFTDAGFQKYLVQHEFEDEEHLNNSANVAFWTNLGISVVLWGVISIFCKPLAKLIGSTGYELEMIVACLQLPITSFSSIQRAIYRRRFDFKSLSLMRVVTASIPLIVTVPFAIIGFGCWALIIGNIARVLIFAIMLTVKSRWKPRCYYNVKLFKEMFSFSSWTLLESILDWLNNWVDIFVIGTAFSAYYLGIYKNSQQLVNALTSLITAVIVPIMFSTLSRLQNDESEFQNTFYYFQKITAYFVLPLGVGVFAFRDLAVDIMLGDGWSEAAIIIGAWALTSCVLIICSNFYVEVYRAKGQPRLSVLTQIINLSLLIPALWISKDFGFWTLVYTRAGMRLVNVLIGTIIMTLVLHFRFRDIIKNLVGPVFCTIIMGIFAIVGKSVFDAGIQHFLLIIICIACYIVSVYLCVPKDFAKIISFFTKKK